MLALGRHPDRPALAVPTLAEYLSLVPPEHSAAPRFIATLTALLQPLVDQQALLASMPLAYDLDQAVGVQLDAVGLWIGRSRFVLAPIGGVFFSFDTPALGWEAGLWLGQFDSLSGLTRLDDEPYRLLLRAKVAANHWDGTLAGAAAAFAYVFSDANTHVFIQDNQDMSFSLNVAGVPLTPLMLSLLTNNYIPLKPAGVRLANINQVTVGGTPLFGFDLNTVNVGGFELGSWGDAQGVAVPDNTVTVAGVVLTAGGSVVVAGS